MPRQPQRFGGTRLGFALSRKFSTLRVVELFAPMRRVDSAPHKYGTNGLDLRSIANAL
jgi:hypothetical protein